jgi:hypothetical protein
LLKECFWVLLYLFWFWVFFFLLVCFATERLKELNKLLEDVARTAISTGPRGAIRLAQGIEAVVSVGGEYLLQLYRVFFLCSLLSTPSSHTIHHSLCASPMAESSHE